MRRYNSIVILTLVVEIHNFSAPCVSSFKDFAEQSGALWDRITKFQTKLSTVFVLFLGFLGLICIDNVKQNWAHYVCVQICLTLSIHIQPRKPRNITNTNDIFEENCVRAHSAMFFLQCMQR